MVDGISVRRLDLMPRASLGGAHVLNIGDDPPRLLAAFAHPDDEQWGTAGALLACAERGIEIHVLSATSGDAGEISEPALATRRTLGAVREEELRTACAMLGFQPPILLRHGDGQLAVVERELLVGQIAVAIRRLRPRVVLTFDANGGYGHLDHIVIHQATLAAWECAADPIYNLPVGIDFDRLPPHRPDKLYATAYPHSRVVKLNADLQRLGFATIDFGSVQTLYGDEILTPDELVTTVVPVAHLWERRWASLRAHRTQYGADHPFIAVGSEVASTWLPSDCFRRIHPAPAAGAPLPDEDDLWAGLPPPGGAS